MSAAAWFITGWICASAFIAIGIAVHHLRRQWRSTFQTTTQWIDEHGGQEPLQQVGRGWYPPIPGRQRARAS